MRTLFYLHSLFYFHGLFYLILYLENNFFARNYLRVKQIFYFFMLQTYLNSMGSESLRFDSMNLSGPRLKFEN